MCLLKPSIPPYTNTPYHFIETGINVYSLEELLFHCGNYWKESLNDLMDGGVSAWVKGTLGLGFLGSQIDKILASDAPFSEKYLNFLSIEDYFDADDLVELENSIVAWENKTEFEKLKHQGDERLHENDYEKAVYYYEKLLNYGETAAIYNNIGCCRMKLGELSEAETGFLKALELDRRNSRIKLNMATLHLLQNRQGDTERLLKELVITDNDRYVQYCLGDLELRRNNLEAAEKYFKCSASMGNTADANAALCKIALKTKDFASARVYAERIPDKTSAKYLEIMASINYAADDKQAALKNAEQLLDKNFNKAGSWAFAAKLYRETGNLEKASYAIDKAHEIDQFDEEAIFEKAKIKKELGKTLEYQSLLSTVVDKWKARYKLSS